MTRASLEVEIIEDRSATMTLRLKTGFGDPIIMVPKDAVKIVEVPDAKPV